MKPITGAEIDTEAKLVSKKLKLQIPTDDPELAEGAAKLQKLNADAQRLGDRLDRLLAAKAALQAAIRDRDLAGQLAAEAEVAAVGGTADALTSSLLAVADQVTNLEREMERRFAEITAGLATPWWSATAAIKAKADELARAAAVQSHVAARLAHERSRVFDLQAVNVGTPRPWRKTLRQLGHASRAAR